MADVYYTALLQHVGCTAFRHEAATLFGRDDDAFVAGRQGGHARPPRGPRRFLPDLARGLPAPTVRTLALAVARGGDGLSARTRYPVPGTHPAPAPRPLRRLSWRKETARW